MPESSTTPIQANLKEDKAGERRPSLNQSWEVVSKAVAKYDEEMVQNWKDDIETLLIFAGLFSAVVTAFVVESYQWLQEDPADTTVVLLTQMIMLHVNGSQTPIPERPPFQPDASSIRINCFWFLSLIFSLTSALFGLLCKQWLREHKRDPPTNSPGEALALRQLRRDSFDKWGVCSFLSALPILLEVALLLFFAGVLDLLWARHRIPFICTFVAVMLSAGLYFVTTLLPTIAIPGDQKIWQYWRGEVAYQYICPYKSPQAWAVYRLSCSLVRPWLKFRVIANFAVRYGLWNHIQIPYPDWSACDLARVRQFDPLAKLHSNTHRNGVKLYKLRAFQWATVMFRDSPLMLPHLNNIIATLEPSLAMSAIFGEWRFAMWKHLTQLDVECYCIDSGSFYSSSGEGTGMYIWAASRPQIQDAYSRNGIKLLLCHQYWSAKAASPSLDLAGLNQLFKSIQEANLQEVSGLRFVIPFPIAEALWRHPNPVVRKESLQLLPLFEEAWQHSPALEESRHDSDRLAFIVALTEHLRTDCISELTRRRRGLEFIRYVHGHIITRRLYQYDPKRRYQLYDQKRRRRLLVSDWVDAITKAHHVYNEQVPNNKRLPPDFFAPIPPPIEPLPIDIPPASVSPSGVRYSSDTVIDIVNGEVQVVDINEDPNGTEFIRLHAAASLPPTEMVNSTMEDAWQESKPPSAGGVEGLG